MRPLWRGRSEPDYLSDVLTLLAEWTREGQQIKRTLVLDDTQHAALTERVKIVSDALRLRPEIRRLDGRTQIKVGSACGTEITESEVTLAARIEDVFRAVTSAG